jgi:beta-xylosidase
VAASSSILVSVLALLASLGAFSAATAQEVSARNPIIWADVPDPAVVRVGDVYYMSSTTMHMNPGLPIMRSRDLVNWEIVSYAYDILADNDPLALRNGEDAYGRGSWASSIRYVDGTFYVITFSYSTGRTHVFRTADVENGPWIEHTIDGVFHDMSLLFDDDGRVYMIYGAGDIRIRELAPDLTALQAGGLDRILIPDAGSIAAAEYIVPAEGAHIHKIDGKYYIFLIVWPQGGMRTQLVYRADHLGGPWEGRVALQDSGIAQGGLVDTPDGRWYSMLFQDHGAVGRIPYLLPVTWEDGWPVLGVGGRAPRELDIPAGEGGLSGIIVSDEFDYPVTGLRGSGLEMAWQWNHNPDHEHWSVAERPGYLRLTNGRIDTGFLDTQNTLTQRTFGPRSSAHVAVEVAQMKNGDHAGLGLLQKNYGSVGVRMSGGTRSIVMVDGSAGTSAVVERVPITQDRVHLRVDVDYQDRADTSYFFYSLDGVEWQAIGSALRMSYTLPHFMGYRFALFNYATEATDGFVDFDFYRVGHASGEQIRNPVR